MGVPLAPASPAQSLDACTCITAAARTARAPAVLLRNTRGIRSHQILCPMK